MIRVGVSAWSWRSLDECTEAVPVLVCHDEVVVECALEQAAEVKARLEKAIIEGMDIVINARTRYTCR